jgi:hypothetical protein
MTSEKFWYSPIYKIKNSGFYISKCNNNMYLGYRYLNGKEVSIPIKNKTFNVLKEEWK